MLEIFVKYVPQTGINHGFDPTTSTFAIHDHSPTSYLTCYSQKHDGNLAPCYVLDALKAPHII